MQIAELSACAQMCKCLIHEDVKKGDSGKGISHLNLRYSVNPGATVCH